MDKTIATRVEGRESRVPTTKNVGGRNDNGEWEVHPPQSIGAGTPSSGWKTTDPACLKKPGIQTSVLTPAEDGTGSTTIRGEEPQTVTLSPALSHQGGGRSVDIPFLFLREPRSPA